jgi:amino-acid N-acetyltransferase
MHSPIASNSHIAQEFLISVLESTATKRDAKAYLQTFGTKVTGGGPKKPPTPVVLHDGIRAVSEAPRFVQGPEKEGMRAVDDDTPHVAIVKLREPQAWDDALLDGVTKTLTQLRDLGLLSIIVLDCGLGHAGASERRETIAQQTYRTLKAIGKYGSPAAEVVDSSLWKLPEAVKTPSPLASTSVFVGFEEALTTPLRFGHILIIAPHAYSPTDLKNAAADPNEVVFALTRFFSGLQLDSLFPGAGKRLDESNDQPFRRALVDRIIIIDPLGGIPSTAQGNGARVFINLEQEFDDLRGALASQTNIDTPNASGHPREKHVENLRLVRSALAILPSTASAIITSPAEAANAQKPKGNGHDGVVDHLTGEVRTRRWQNPLIHNLLTDRPLYSSSLPIGRVKPTTHNAEVVLPRMPTTTLAKRGLPVTIFPDTRSNHWLPPKPGAPRLRLTDPSIDLPRLVHLINDSFGRKLDVEHYLARIQDSLAGIIIAGEYEGGAILTWERPFGLDEETAYGSGRLVPYLDKFAVLKRSQGAGGVADIVFNAMVRDCFPGGVCWRSRKNNPVNKWYSERSRGMRKLAGSNWSMFWTGQDASLN